MNYGWEIEKKKLLYPRRLAVLISLFRKSELVLHFGMKMFLFFTQEMIPRISSTNLRVFRVRKIGGLVSETKISFLFNHKKKFFEYSFKTGSRARDARKNRKVRFRYILSLPNRGRVTFPDLPNINLSWKLSLYRVFGKIRYIRDRKYESEGVHTWFAPNAA